MVAASESDESTSRCTQSTFIEEFHRCTRCRIDLRQHFFRFAKRWWKRLPVKLGKPHKANDAFIKYITILGSEKNVEVPPSLHCSGLQEASITSFIHCLYNWMKLHHQQSKNHRFFSAIVVFAISEVTRDVRYNIRTFAEKIDSRALAAIGNNALTELSVNPALSVT